MSNIVAGSAFLPVETPMTKKYIHRGDDYTLRAVRFCALALPEGQDFRNRRSRPAVMKIKPFGLNAVVETQTARRV
jgi:hypothetical protein